MAALREEIKRERVAFRDLWEPPGGFNRDYPKAKKASRESRRAPSMDCDDPSDFSAASATAETQIGFSFDPPTSW